MDYINLEIVLGLTDSSEFFIDNFEIGIISRFILIPQYQSYISLN